MSGPPRGNSGGSNKGLVGNMLFVSEAEVSVNGFYWRSSGVCCISFMRTENVNATRNELAKTLA